MKKIFFLMLIAHFTLLNAFGQDNKAIQDAFTNSYAFEKKADYSKAIDELKRVYKEDSYEINVRLGWLTYNAGLFTESAAYYQKAMTILPLSIEAKLGMVLPASALGNWEQVKAEYNSILKIDPYNMTANYRMGLIYYGKLDYTNALKYFEKVVNCYPFDYSGNLYFAWTNLKLGKLREAKILFNKVLLIQPNDTSALEGLGMIK
jgi:tetratricopeptide (TPR) repeat protein